MAFLFLKLVGKNIHIHWQGTDVQELGKLSYPYSKLICNTTQAPWLKKELASKGIIALSIPIIPKITTESLPMPKKLTILFYVAEGRTDLYNYQLFCNIVFQHPEINFLVVGEIPKEEKIRCFPNLKYLGYVEDMKKLYSSVTALLRIPQHDGLSFMVLEALAYGRYVIWNKGCEGCFYAPTSDSLEKYLELLSKVSQIPNEQGIQYYKRILESSNMAWEAILTVLGRDV